MTHVSRARAEHKKEQQVAETLRGMGRTSHMADCGPLGTKGVSGRRVGGSDGTRTQGLLRERRAR